MNRVRTLPSSARLCLLVTAVVAGAATAVLGADGPTTTWPDVGECQLIVRDTHIEGLRLANEHGIARTLKELKSPILLPPGQYRVQGVKLQGDEHWQTVATTKRPTFTLSRDAPHELEGCNPLKPNVEVARRGRVLHLDYDVLNTRDGDTRNESRKNPPQFTVYKSGKEIGSGTFEYG